MRYAPASRTLPTSDASLRLRSRGNGTAGGSMLPPGRLAIATGAQTTDTVAAASQPQQVQSALLLELIREVVATRADSIGRALRIRAQGRSRGLRVGDMDALDSLLSVQRDAIVGMLSYPMTHAEMTLVAERIGRFPDSLWLPGAMSGLERGRGDGERFSVAMDSLAALLEGLAQPCANPMVLHEQAGSSAGTSPVCVQRDTGDAPQLEQERAQVTLDAIADAVLSTNLTGELSYLNHAAEQMTGWSHREALGRPLTEVLQIVGDLSGLPVANPVLQAITENRPVTLAADSVLIRRSGVTLAVEDSAAPIHDRDGQVVGAVMVLRDVSESRAAAQRMSHLAQHDALTGLPNRVLLSERLSQAIRRGQRHNTQVALLYLDIDHFKHINDSLGHAVGDHLLQLMAERLTSSVRAMDTVCRQGGDEFVILLAEIEKRHDAAQVAEKLLLAASVSQRVGEHELQLSYSIGISVFPQDGEDAPSLLHSADIAMYQAKSKGRNNYRFFEAGPDSPCQPECGRAPLCGAEPTAQASAPMLSLPGLVR